MRSFVHSIQLFAFDLLRSQLKFPASYPKYRSASTCKEDPDAKLRRMLLRYLKTQLLHQDKDHKICYTRIAWLETRLEKFKHLIISKNTALTSRQASKDL